VKGRKRHLLVDTLGLVLSVFVSRASLGEREGAKIVFRRTLNKWILLLKVFVDGGYIGTEFGALVQATYGWILEVVKRNELHTFKILPKRWIVERTFGWLNRFRRLSKDYEYYPKTSETVIYWAMIRIMLRRICGRASYCPLGYKRKQFKLYQL